ncbi:hypothetical protein Q7P37_010501 [Cladosporium fusiforme]
MAWNEQYAPYSSSNPAFLSATQHFQSPQNATDESNSRGQRAAERATYGQQLTASSSAFQTPQEQPSGFSQWSGYPAAGNEQRSQYYQPNGTPYPGYASQSSTQTQLNSWSAPEHVPGTQNYSQYGHVNPTFLPQPPVATHAHSAATAAPNSLTTGYGRSYTGFGATFNGGQWPVYGHGYGANQVPLANSQTQAASWQQTWAQYENAIQQIQRQREQEASIPSTNATDTRYAPQFSQPPYSGPQGVHNPLLGSPMNPMYMRSQQLTPSGENPRQYLLSHPEPTPSYLQRAQLPPRRLTEPKKLLIILDLNGTLLLRSNRGSNYTPRPNVHPFLSYCLAHHTLIVWSSARPHNVTAMVEQLFTRKQREKLVKVWSREHLRLGEHYNEKVQVYKQLSWLWEDAEVQASFPPPASEFKVEDGWKEPPAVKWDQSNTVLLDDSMDKAASEPHNLLQIDEFTKENKADGADVLGRVLAYIEGLKWEADVSSAMRNEPFVKGEGDEWDWEKMCPKSIDGVKV